MVCLHKRKFKRIGNPNVLGVPTVMIVLIAGTGIELI